jgi:CheY-like chemotaxis protein
MSKVLIIEDEANIRKLISVNLMARGYDVIEAEDAREGLALLRDELPAILLLDIKLPDLSGWEILKIIASNPDYPQIPVIVITASLTNGKPDDALYTNLRQVLSKPVSIKELTHAIKEALN